MEFTATGFFLTFAGVLPDYRGLREASMPARLPRANTWPCSLPARPARARIPRFARDDRIRGLGCSCGVNQFPLRAIHKKIAGKMLVARRRSCLVVSFHANPPVPAVKTKFVCLSLSVVRMLVWGRAPPQACPERSRGVQAEAKLPQQPRRFVRRPRKNLP